MKQYLTAKYGAFLAVVASLATYLGFGGALVAHAQDTGLSTTTALTIATGATNDLGSVLANLIPVILGIVVALLAIGMGLRYVKRHISGKKF